MIITVTLNPAIDKTILLNDFEIDKVNRVDSFRVDVGGKGINVSKVLRELNTESLALGFVGGRNGEYIEKFLDKSKIDHDFVKTEVETRINIKVVDIKLNTNTDINEKGARISIENFKEFEKRIERYANEENIFVFAGSIPEGLDKNIYRNLIEIVNKNGGKVILDAEGELFTEGLKGQPMIVKPNNFELEKIIGKKLDSVDEIIKGAKALLDYGVEKVVVSLGGEGALFITKDYVKRAFGLKVKVSSTVGAGDSMVAALAYAEEKRLLVDETINLMIATSAANVMTDGTQAAKIEDIEKLKKLVKIENL